MQINNKSLLKEMIAWAREPEKSRRPSDLKMLEILRKEIGAKAWDEAIDRAEKNLISLDAVTVFTKEMLGFLRDPSRLENSNSSDVQVKNSTGLGHGDVSPAVIAIVAVLVLADGPSPLGDMIAGALIVAAAGSGSTGGEMPRDDGGDGEGGEDERDTDNDSDSDQ